QGGRKLLCERLEPRCEVHGLADDGIFQAIARAHVPRCDFAGVDTHTYPELWEGGVASVTAVQLLHPLQHLNCCLDGVAGVCLSICAERHAEDHHEPIADELVKEAAIRSNHLFHSAEIAIEPGQHVRGGFALGQMREIPDVRKEDGHCPFLTGQHNLVAALPDLRRDFRRDVAPEKAHDFLAFCVRLCLQLPLI